MTAALRTMFAWVFLGLMTLSLSGCFDQARRDAAPVITQQPGSLSVSEGSPASFTVAASPPSATIQWYRNGTPISGATNATYTIAAVTAADNGARFFAVAATKGGNVASGDAILTVRAAPPVIGTQPASVTVNAGATATFTVAATGSGLTYQWQKGGTNIPGATTASYTTPATVAADDGAQFRVIVTNTGGSVTSNAATLTVIVPPAITTQPASASVNVGATATFTVVATGSNLTYQWQRGTTNITGATSASYTTPATVIGDNGATFRVVVTNAAGSVTSSAATLTVTNPVPPSTFRTTPMVSDYANGGVALKADGTVWAWGNGASGENGNGQSGLATSPVQVLKSAGVPLTRITKISAGASHVLALDDTGAVWTWGTSASLGSQAPSGGATSAFAQQVLADSSGTTFLSNVVDVAAGNGVSYAALADGTVVAWGSKRQGSMGDGTATVLPASVQPFPRPVPGLTGIVEVSAGSWSGFARSSTGTIYAWGRNVGGSIGNGSFSDQASPVTVSGISSAVRVVGNGVRTMALLADGTAAIWGQHAVANQPACATPGNYQASPTFIARPTGGTASTFASIAPFINASGFVYGGSLYQTEIPLDGSPSATCVGQLVQTAGLANVVGVARSYGTSTHVWLTDGAVIGLGDNYAAQLGAGDQDTTARVRTIPNFNLLGAPATGGTSVLSLDFESALPPSVNAGTAFLTDGQGYKGLGPVGNQFGGNILRSPTGNPVTVTLTNLPAHTSINLSFLFAAIDSLDGAGTFPAGDYLKITLDGKQIFREAFANATPTQIQTYVSPPGVELARRVDLGFEGPGSFYTDSAYNMGADPQFQLIPHTSSTLTITFTIESDVLQPLNDESWGLDNLRISLNP